VNRFDLPPESWADTEEHLRKLAISVRGAMNGRTNNTQLVTLTADATSTAVEVDGVTDQTIAQLVPRTASAAVALAAGVVYQTSDTGTITIHHDSNAATDRTFGLTYHS